MESLADCIKKEWYNEAGVIDNKKLSEHILLIKESTVLNNVSIEIIESFEIRNTYVYILSNLKNLSGCTVCIYKIWRVGIAGSYMRGKISKSDGSLSFLSSWAPDNLNDSQLNWVE